MLPLNRETKNLPVNHPPKILQFGGGNFLRAFVNYLCDELNEKAEFKGGVIVVKPTPRGDYAALRNQSGLFHLWTRGVKQGTLVSDIKIVQSIIDVVHPYQNWEDYLATAKLASIQFIVSNTTEAGIEFDPNDQWTDHPAKSFPGKLTQWLLTRFEHFNGAPTAACTFLPCELINQNGAQLKQCILQYIEHWGLSTEFKNWIDKHQVFCNTLVDRIVPGHPGKEAIIKETGFDDELAVACEPYLFWAIESQDSRLPNRLPLDLMGANVLFTDNLDPYRTRKVRILNGAHIAMVPVGVLAGLDTVGEVMEDDSVKSYILSLLDDEVVPTLNMPIGELKKYVAEVLDRFKNPYIKHHLMSIALNATSKFQVRLLPSLFAYQQRRGGFPPRIKFAIAALILFYRGHYKGNTIELKDSQEVIDFFKQEWNNYNLGLVNLETLVKSILSSNLVWGRDLSILTQDVYEILSSILANGIRPTLQSGLALQK